MNNTVWESFSMLATKKLLKIEQVGQPNPFDLNLLWPVTHPIHFATFIYKVK